MNVEASHPTPEHRHRHRRLVMRLLGVVALSFAFGFALVPLYDAFFEATGLNGKTAGQATLSTGGLGWLTTAPPSRIDSSRIVTVEFTGTVMPGLPWDMPP